MNNHLILTLRVCLLLVISAYPQFTLSEQSVGELVSSYSDYRLGTGDTIKITVFDEPGLSFEIKLSDAGTVSYPFLGEIQASGLAIGQLESRIRQGLMDGYLVDPTVSVSIVQYRQFFIHGEVSNPGGFPFLPGLTLRKAIALAGGFTQRASRSKIYVIRDGVEYDSDRGRTILLNEELAPGDIVRVEQSFF